MPVFRGDDPYADFQRDLDEASRLSEDPFGIDVGGLDEEDLEILGYGPKRVRRAPADEAERVKPKAKAKPKRKT